MAPRPTKLEWTASGVGKALPEKIYTQNVNGRVRTWSGANGVWPKDEAAAEERAKDLLSVAITAATKLAGVSDKTVTVREATLKVPSRLLDKHTPEELALLLAIQTDSFD